MAAEAEEREFYAHRAPPEWLEVLQPLGTDASKPFLQTAPRLIAVFIRRFERLADGTKRKHYYTDESVGFAAGLLLVVGYPAAGALVPDIRRKPLGEIASFVCAKRSARGERGRDQAAPEALA